MNIRLDHIQLVLFSPGIVVVDKLKTANAVNDALSGILDGDPAIIPLGDDAPPDVPRILMKSKDESYKLQIASTRIDFIFHYRKDEEETSFPVPDLFEKFLKIFQYFRENIHTHFPRSAMVTNWIIELEKYSGAEHLLWKYVSKETPIKKPHELELHYLVRDSIAGIKINKWTRIKSARKKADPEQDRFVTIYIDINTLAEEAYEFNQELLQEFLKESSNVVNDTINEHLKRMEE